MKNNLIDLIRAESMFDLPDEMLVLFVRLYKSLFKEDKVDEDIYFKLAFAIDSAYELILNFCHIDDVPNDLYYFWAKKALSEFLRLGVSRCDSFDNLDVNRAINRLQEGDVSIEFNADDTRGVILQLADYYGLWGEAMRFRKMVW